MAQLWLMKFGGNTFVAMEAPAFELWISKGIRRYLILAHDLKDHFGCPVQRYYLNLNRDRSVMSWTGKGKRRAWMKRISREDLPLYMSLPTRNPEFSKVLKTGTVI